MSRRSDYQIARGAPATAPKLAPIPKAATKSKAERKPIFDDPPICTTRTCLKCRDEFRSTGPGNQICPDCRGRNANVPHMMEGISL